MPLVSLSHVTRHFEGPLILDDVTLDIETGRKIGIIGRNGTGKSTMLKMIVGDLQPSDGEVIRTKGVKIAYQEQELLRPPGTTVRDEMLTLFAEERRREAKLRAMESAMAEESNPETQARLLEEYDRLQEAHHAQQAYGIEQRIASVLSGLGLPESAWDQPLEGFSGGEKNIIGLARVLLSDPDLILLDEPSNHLDLDGLEWFIRWLRQTPVTVLMVSHNRHLLDATVQEIWEVDRAQVTSWAGNYTDWQQQKADALALQERQYKNQQRLIKRLEFQARRLRDMAQAYDDPGQAKRAKAMLRRIEQMDKVERPDDGDRRFHAQLKSADRHGDIALNVKNWSFAYGERKLFDDVSLEVRFGERVCLQGPNGSGKSTLFRHVLGEGGWENQTLRLGKSVRVGDYNQIHQEVMREDQSLVDWLMDQTGLLYQPATEMLHRFLFTRDDLDRPVSTLSGGEKSRLQLARLVHEEVNFLMLDEPTNHLDIESCEQLETMLEEFEGTLLIISHDRYFLDRIVDVVVEIEDSKLVRFAGSFEEWWVKRHKLAEERRAGTLSLHSRKDAAATTKHGTSAASAASLHREERKTYQRERKRLQNRVKKLEGQIVETEERIPQVMTLLEQSYAPGGDKSQAKKLSTELELLQAQLPALEAEWEEAASALEAVPALED